MSIPKYNFKESLKLGFEITSMEVIRKTSKSKLVLPHRQQFYGLFYFTASAGVHIVDFNEYRIQSGDLFFISNEQVHYFNQIDLVSGVVVLFTEAFLENNLLLDKIFEEPGLPLVRFSKQKRQEFENILALLQRAVIGQVIMKKQLLQKYLEIVLIKLYQEKPIVVENKGVNYHRFIALKKDLKIHVQQHKEVSFYATKQHITPKTLNLAVKAVVDKTAKEFIHSYVLLLAKRLLVNSQLSSKEIGYALGFSEPTNFVKFFKNKEGVSPIEFQKVANLY